MTTVSNVPFPGLAPELPLATAAAVKLPGSGQALHQLKDILVSIYAYGVLLFGLLFPFVLAIWHAFFVPAGS